MDWWLAWGKRVQDLERLQTKGVAVKALEDRPEPAEHLRDYWQAYQCLDATRGYGFNGPLAITHSEIESFCRLYQWAPDDAVILAFLCRTLDNRYLSKLAERRAAEAERGNPKGRNRRA